MTVAAIIEALRDREGFSFVGESGLALNRVVVDSRLAGPGDLFVALPGDNTNGHAFIGNALMRGAVAVLAETSEWRPLDDRQPEALILVNDTLAALQQLAGIWRSRHHVKVVGVTGSVGKTTTKEVVAAVLASHYSVLKNAKNLNNEIGLPLTLLELNESHQVAVLEMGMYALGEIDLLCRLAQPDIGIVTNVGPSHLERLGSIERIAMAKEELVRSLPADGVAVLNGDDPYVRLMADRAKASTLFYGTNSDCDLWAGAITVWGLAGTSFDLHCGSRIERLDLRLVGRPGVFAALAAAAAGIAMGLPWEEVVESLRQMPGFSRFTVLEGVKGSVLIDDTYNASPASMIAALETLQATLGRRIAILGDMLELGDQEVSGHRAVGAAVVSVVDHLVVIGPRGRLIGEEAVRLGHQAVTFVENNEEAVRAVVPQLSAGDHVLVKGSRGMHMDEIIERMRLGIV